MFYDRLETLCKENGEKITNVIEMCGFSSGNQSKWKNKDPDLRRSTLTKLADHFNVSIDYLVGRSDKRTLGLSTDDKLLQALIDCFNTCDEAHKLNVIYQIKAECAAFEAEKKERATSTTTDAVCC